MLKMRWQDWVELALGGWLIASPWVLGFQAAQFAMWNAVILGAAIAVYAVIELGIPRVWEEWISMAMGAWLVVSPFALNLSAQRLASWDNIIVGVLIALLAAWAMFSGAQGGEGWHQRPLGH